MAGGEQGVKAGCRACRFAPSLNAMSERDKQREERLAAALRENLRRRKAQTREGEPSPQLPSDD